MRKLLFLLFPLFTQAQDVSIGFWKDYQSYTSASYIAEAGSKIYCVTNGGLFYLDKKDNTLNRMSKVNGLSDIGIKQVAYDTESEITIITYENCNIDLIKNNQIINISDIKRKEIIGNKFINNIIIKEGIAYLSCTFGLVLVDLEKEEVKDTYNVGDNNETYEINGCAFLGDSIIVATSEGMYYAKANSQTLSDYNNWDELIRFNGYETYDNVVASEFNIYPDMSYQIISISYNLNTLIRVYSDTIKVNTEDNQYFEIIDENIISAQYSLVDNEKNIWVADSINGLLKYVNYEYQETFIPEGPASNSVFSIEHLDKLHVCHGGHINYGPLWNKTGASIMTNNYDWINYDYYELENARDIVEVASYNGADYYASYYNGIPKLENGEVVEKYSYHNTNGALDTILNWQWDKKMAISDLKFDNYGNMWGLTSSVIHPLFVKTKDDEWFSFVLTGERLHYDEILIDSYNQKWGIIGRKNSIFVYNDNNTISDKSDDQYKILSMDVGNGNLPSLDIFCFTEDLDGEIWLGMDRGIAVFYNPSAVFSGSNFDAQQILIQEGDYGQYLLNDETVKCIKVDGANRKWIGTEKSGVFLLSEEGTEEIQHFTTENSPLFSNNIIDIAINPENGEVFIGTEKGLISYRSDATTGTTIQAETHVFPNPVRESYNGPIAINGLVTDANVKITDINGNLVFEDFSKGGQAIWNGKNKNGDRASTGVYLVFSTDINGLEKMVSKILFIH